MPRKRRPGASRIACRFTGDAPMQLVIFCGPCATRDAHLEVSAGREQQETSGLGGPEGLDFRLSVQSCSRFGPVSTCFHMFPTWISVSKAIS